VNYSKRATAADQVEVMRPLGFARFAVVRQDCGGRVAHRMGCGHPEAVEPIAVLDIALPATLSAHTDHEPDRGAAVRGRFARSRPERGGRP